MTKKTTSNHGGKRDGAGRSKKPPINYDDKFKKDVLKALKQLKKKNNGVSFLEKVFEMMYDEKVQDTVKASLFKSYKEIFVTKTNETNVNLPEFSGPGIALPPKKIDPSEEMG